MAAYARPPQPVPDTAWWARVRPLLSPRVQDDYQGVDPALVPFTQVTGPPAVLPTDAPADLLTQVLVPTDAGRYLVELERAETGWLVTAVLPATGTGR
jgi:hypothetical protein